MIIELKKIETLNDVKLWQYQKFIEATAGKDIDPDFVNRKALDIFFGVDSKTFNAMPVRDIEQIINDLNKVLEEKPKHEMFFEVNGIKYGFHPNLDNMTFGEFIDIDNRMDVKDWHKLMAVLYRPIIERQGKRYGIKPYDPAATLSDIPLGTALGAVGFFLTLGEQLLSDILKSLKPQELEQAMPKSNTGKSGDGISQSIHLAMATLRDSMTLKIPTSTNVY